MPEQESLIHVTGMTCASCVRHVDRAVRGLDGIVSIAVDLGRGEVLVRHDAAVTPVDRVLTAIRAAGYDARV